MLKVAHAPAANAQADYVNGEECTNGYHVYDPDVKLDDVCLCGRRKFRTVEMGFIKARRA